MKKIYSPLVLVAFFLIALPIVGPTDPFEMLDSLLSHFPDSVQMVLFFCIMPIMMLYGQSYMIGTGILAFLVGAAIRKQAKEKFQTWEPLIVPIIALVWLASQPLIFLRIPTGTPIRPMGWALYVMMSACTLTLFCIINAIVLLKNGKNKTTCFFSLFIGIGLLVVPYASLHFVAQIKGLMLEP